MIRSWLVLLSLLGCFVIFQSQLCAQYDDLVIPVQPSSLTYIGHEVSPYEVDDSPWGGSDSPFAQTVLEVELPLPTFAQGDEPEEIPQPPLEFEPDGPLQFQQGAEEFEFEGAWAPLRRRFRLQSWQHHPSRSKKRQSCERDWDRHPVSFLR